MSPSRIPLWGRAWKLTVTLASGEQQFLSQDSFDPEALRLTFDVLQSAIPSPYWFADITIYNASGDEMQQLLGPAVPTRVTLEAGYQFGPQKSTIIWDGPVLQVIFGAENVVDQFVRFNCIGTDATLENNFQNTAVGPMSQYQVVSQMITQMNGTPSQQISPAAQAAMSAYQYPRGKGLFGKAAKILPEIAASAGFTTWMGPDGQHFISEMDDQTRTNPDVIYGPAFPPGHVGRAPVQVNGGITRSLIDVPAQSSVGCDFTVLLDPRLQVRIPPMLVQLDQAIIRQMKRQIGQALFPLDSSGIYIAGQIRHYGDTRGNDWYSSVTGYRRNYAQVLDQIGAPNQ